jgi:hypothetical protein
LAGSDTTCACTGADAASSAATPHKQDVHVLMRAPPFIKFGITIQMLSPWLRFPKRDYGEGPAGISQRVRFNRHSVTALPSPLPCGQNRSTYPRGFEGRQARPKVTLAPSHNHLRNTWGTLHGTQ